MKRRKKTNVRRSLGSALGKRVNGDLVGFDLVFVLYCRVYSCWLSDDRRKLRSSLLKQGDEEITI